MAFDGSGMLIRGETAGIEGRAAQAARARAIPLSYPPMSLPTQLLGGLLLLIGP
jgi:hypothetical protein